MIYEERPRESALGFFLEKAKQRPNSLTAVELYVRNYQEGRAGIFSEVYGGRMRH